MVSLDLLTRSVSCIPFFSLDATSAGLRDILMTFLEEGTW